MEKKIEEIQKTNKIKIFYNKETTEFCGAGFLDYIKVNQKLTKKITDDKKLEFLGSLLNKQNKDKKEIGVQFNGKEQEELIKEVENINSSIEVNFDEWCEFIKVNYDIIKVIDNKLIGETIPQTLEQVKTQKISSRKAYRKQMFEEWFDDMENMPTDIKNKLALEKIEIKTIKNATKETINDFS